MVPIASDASASGRRPVKVLFLASNPACTERLRIDRETRQIRDRLRATTHADHVHIIWRWAVRFDDLLQALLEVQPDIVHFSGHGTHSQEILLEDERGSDAPISAPALAGLFGVLKDRIALVVLNACYSRPQAEAINEHIDCTIGMGMPVSDEAAIEFAATFYQAIGFGRSIQTAFDLARRVLECKRIPGSDIPQLFTRPGIEARNVVLVNQRGDSDPVSRRRVEPAGGVAAPPRSTIQEPPVPVAPRAEIVGARTSAPRAPEERRPSVPTEVPAAIRVKHEERAPTQPRDPRRVDRASKPPAAMAMAPKPAVLISARAPAQETDGVRRESVTQEPRRPCDKVESVYVPGTLYEGDDVTFPVVLPYNWPFRTSQGPSHFLHVVAVMCLALASATCADGHSRRSNDALQRAIGREPLEWSIPKPHSIEPPPGPAPYENNNNGKLETGAVPPIDKHEPPPVNPPPSIRLVPASSPPGPGLKPSDECVVVESSESIRTIGTMEAFVPKRTIICYGAGTVAGVPDTL